MRDYAPAALASLLVVACSSSCASRGAEITPRVEVVQAIQELEELRPVEATSQLAAIARGEASWHRQRAARALGRIDAIGSVTPLCTALGDRDPQVRAEVAFALGQLSQPEARTQALGALLPMLSTTDALLLRRVLEAIGKLGDRTHVDALFSFLAHADATVRSEAVIALHRIRSREARRTAGAEDNANSNAERDAMRKALLRAMESETASEVRWRVLYALAALRDPACLELFCASTSAQTVWERFFAVRGIAELARARRIRPDALDSTLDLVLRRLEDSDLRVQLEAALCIGDPSPGGRGTSSRDAPPPFSQRRALDGLIGMLQASSATLAAVAARGIGHFRSRTHEANNALVLALSSPEVQIRAAAIEANARLLADDYAGVLRVYAKDDDWRIRAACARATRFANDPIAQGLLDTLARDDATKVRIAVLKALQGRRATTAFVALVTKLLRTKDAALREEGAATLASLGDAQAVPTLRETFASSRAPEFADARVAIIEALVRLAPRDAATAELFESALEDPQNRVRRAAWKALGSRGDGRAVPRLRLSDEGRKVATPGRDYPLSFLAAKHVVELETNKGRIVLELDASKAPSHVHNLLHFIRKGAYDGRIFHRVVPNFVVQGGDARGDGYGNITWWGGSLRREIAPDTGFDAFALGMPRGSDVDSGGDQIFITTIPTPHLDGRYTRFGRVSEGRDVVLDIEVGDRIERARVRGDS